jgi:DNA-binding transcriptional regulator GbsR (MarR family)
MDQNTLLQKLKEFGLVENEARVYLGLVLKGPLRPGEISEISGVARAEVHRHLRSLEKKGFSLVVAGKRKQYAAAPPDEVLSSLVEQTKSKRDQMVKKKEALISAWGAVQHSLGLSLDESERFQFLKDTQIGIERGTKLLTSAEKVARVLLHLATFEAYFSDGLVQSSDFLAILGSGKEKPQAEVRILIVSQIKELGNLRGVLSEVEPALNLRVRLVASPLLEAMPDAVIIDEKELLLRAAPTKRIETDARMGGETRAIITNISTMVNPFVILFDENWIHGIDYYPEKSPNLLEPARLRRGDANESRSEILEDRNLDPP